MKKKGEMAHYVEFLASVKQRIRQAQLKAALSVNSEMVLMYWDIGRMIHLRQRKEGWGSGIIPLLSQDIRNELPVVKGFSERNIKRMLRFYREYLNLQHPDENIVPQLAAQMLTKRGGPPIVPQVAAQIKNGSDPSISMRLVLQIPWFHHVILIEKIKDATVRLWYMEQIIENGWSRSVLISRPLVQIV